MRNPAVFLETAGLSALPTPTGLFLPSQQPLSESPKLPALRADVSAKVRARHLGFLLLRRLRLLPPPKAARRRSGFCAVALPRHSRTSAQRPVFRLPVGTRSAVPRKPHKPPTRARRRGTRCRSQLHLLHLLRFRHFRLRICGNRVPLTILSLSHGHKLLLQQFFCRNGYLPPAFSGMRRHRRALPEPLGVLGSSGQRSRTVS